MRCCVYGSRKTSQMPEFFDSPAGLRNVALVSAETLRKAEQLMVGCEECSPDDAELPFDSVLDCVTGNDASVTDYVMVECMAKCPQCRRAINEKTLVEVSP